MEISIVVPMYNCEKTITETADSIKNQSFKDFEVILIDDGSTDNTKDIANDICKSDKRFKYIYKKNEGAPSARNKGISHSRGKYIYFCDADDILSENCIQLLYNKAVKTNADLVVGEIAHFRENVTEFLKYPVYPKSAKILKTDKYWLCDPVPGTKLYRKSLINKYNLKFDDVKIGQDLNFFAKFLLVCKKVEKVDYVVYFYRETPNSISRTYKLSNLIDINQSISLVIKFGEENMLLNRVQRKKIEYVKLGHYVWQLRKKNHLANTEYKLLRRTLCRDVNIIKHFDLKFWIAYRYKIFEFIMIKYLGKPIKYI